jgi:hypothetical protein
MSTVASVYESILMLSLTIVGKVAVKNTHLSGSISVAKVSMLAGECCVRIPPDMVTEKLHGAVKLTNGTLRLARLAICS